MAGNRKNTSSKNGRGVGSLRELDRLGRRRLGISAVVALACFVAGIGLVAGLHAPVADDAEAAALDGPQADGAGETEPSSEPAAAPTKPPPSTEKPELQGDAPDEPPPADPRPDGAAEVAGADDGDEVGGQDPERGEDAPAAGGDWWERVRGKKCRIQFGEHPRLVLREGELDKDQTTTYGPFVDAPIVLRVRKNRQPSVVPHHFGFHPRSDMPALAFVTVVQQDREVEGILPLKIGDDYLELVPAEP